MSDKLHFGSAGTCDTMGSTLIKFNPPTRTDTIRIGGGVLISVPARYPCITVMEEYKHKSLEELRLEDYRNGTVAVLELRERYNRWEKTLENIFERVRPVTSPPIKCDAAKKHLRQLELIVNAFQIRDIFAEASTQTGEEMRDSKLHQGLKEMLLNSKHSDFVLNVKGVEFRVHKIILEAHSPVFAAMLEHDTKERADGMANIDDCEPHTITKFLNFLYTERVENLNSDDALDLYKVADKYQVTKLSSICIKFMKNNISIENFCEILSLSLCHHVRELTELATQFFLQNSTEIAVTAKWQAFLIENPIAGNELFLKALNLKKK